MATNNTDIVFRLLGKDSGFKQMMSEAQLASATTAQKMQYHMAKVGQSMSNVGRSMSIGVTLPIVAGMGLAVKSASDLEESLNAVSVTFGKAAKGINKLGKEAATSVGLSATEFNALAVQFSSFAKIVAGPGGDVVKQMDELTTRAADFASVMNLDVKEAARIFQSGLAGESEPLRKYGIDVSAATVNTFAYANGIAKAGEQLTEAQKVQARYGLIMKATAKDAGDFANTSDGLANRSRILKATLKNLSAELGTVLLPVITSVAAKVGGLVGWVAQLSPAWKRVAVMAAVVVAAIGPFLLITGKMISSIGALIPVISKVIGVMKLLNLAMLTNPIGIIIIAIVALVAAFVILWTKCEWFRNFWIAVWDEVKAQFELVWPVIKKVVDFIVTGIQELWDTVSAAVKRFWNWAGPFIKTAVTAWWEGIKINIGLIRRLFELVWPIIVAVVRGAIGTIKTIIDGIKTVIAVIAAVWHAIRKAAEIQWDLVVGIVRAAVAAAKLVAEKFNQVKDIVLDVFRAIRKTATGIWDDITGVVGDAFTNIKAFANDIIRAINWVITKVNSIAHTSIGTLGLFGGGSSTPKSSTTPTRTTPKTSIAPMHAGAPGDEETHGGGRGGLGGDTAKWISDLWEKFDLTNRLPKPSGGMFGGATSFMYGLAKDAIISLLKKYGGGDRQRIVDFAKSRLGDPYVWGGSAPGGFDCSGLLYWAYMQGGHPIPRIPTYGGTQISRGAIQPADIMFYYPGAMQAGQRVPFGHFKMYAGNNQTIESASGGVQTRTADWGGAAQIRSYMALGGITRGLSIAGEAGPEAIIPLTNAKRGAAVMREAGLIGGDTYVVNMGTVYATSPRQAQAVANDIIHRLATAKRQTARGTA